jgi:formylglycine-generating enzyme required for sulfatase activity
MPIFITIFISIFLYGYTPQLSAIPLSGASTDGQTSATFYGSAYLSSDSNFEEKTSFSSNDSIAVRFTIEPDIADVGKSAPIYMVRFYNNQWLMKNEDNNWVSWDLNIPSLERAEMRVLGKNNVISVDSGLTGLAGKFHFYVGYGLPSGGVVYNWPALEFDVKQVQVVKDLTKVSIVEASSIDANEIVVSWLAAEDDTTAAKDLIYTLHVSENKNFQPSSLSANTQVTGQLSAIATGLIANTQYYVIVVAKDKDNNESWSNVFSVKTVATKFQRSQQVVVVQDADQVLNVTENSVTFKSTDNVPEVGDVISSSQGDGYLRKVKQVTTKDGQVHVETEPARLNEVFDDLELSTTVKIKPVNQATQAVARSSRSMMRMRNINRQQQITWEKSGFSLITDVSPTRQTKTLELEDDLQVKEGSYAKLQAPAYLSAKVGQSLLFEVTAATTTAINDWEICKIKLVDIEHSNSDLEKLANPQVGEPIITDVEQKGKVNVIWTPEKKHIDTEGRPYRLIFAAYIDDRGDDCNGDETLSRWRETLTVEVPIYINYGEDNAQLNLEDKPLTFNGDFSVTNKTTFEFVPKLSIEAKIKKSSLQSAQIKANVDVRFINDLLINAHTKGSLKDEQTIINPRKFIKVFMAGSVPIIVAGEFALKARIEGEVTGKMNLQKRLEINFLDSSFGMEYQRDRNQQWQAIKNFEPNYKFELKGDADASANITLTLIPDLQISFYDAASGRILVEPYTYAEADLHGQFRYLNDKKTSGYDLDYWFNKLEAGGGVNLKLFAGLEIFGINVISYPDDGDLDKPDTFKKISPIKKTPLWALPTLEAKMDISKALPDNSRSLLITGLATDVPFPFGDKKSLNPFRNWTTPKVLDPDSETVVNSSIASLKQNTEMKLGNYWLSYTKSGKYRLRLRGYSQGGRWLRQKVDIDIDLSDQDGDGMPDLWEKQYDVSDPQQDDDNDGVNNLEEFQQGTYPNESRCGSNSSSTFRDPLKDGGYGPEMVCIPAGTFQMWQIGKPVHKIGQFAMAKYEVTFAEYDKFADATGRNKPYDRGWGRGNRPVINVSWYDAESYAKWLSDQTGKQYRLPTEAEWEYAARAGTETKFWWGNEIGKNKANCNNCGDSFDYTSVVGSFAANQFGLYDTYGNVSEWTCSANNMWWTCLEYYNLEQIYSLELETLGVISISFTIRGGSWGSNASVVLLPDNRKRLMPSSHGSGIGFRVSRQ